MNRKPPKKKHLKLTEEQKKARADEQKKRRREAAFRRKVRSVFSNAGFTYINTEGKAMVVGRREIEIDAVFLYENILLICEDTTAKAKDKDHIRSKSEAFVEIDSNFTTFLNILGTRFPELAEKLEKYSSERYLRYFLYFSMNELNLTSDEVDMYSNLQFVEPKNLDYLSSISQCIRQSARYEVFRFLKITTEQIGSVSSESGRTRISAPIIYPKEITGLRNGVRVVSFMMSAESLIKTCYVLRKDNWQESAWLYQRLIDKDKIGKIREYLVNKSEAFFNNVIVALPDNTNFADKNGSPIHIDKLSDFESCKIELPDDINSICIIDGQHRIFAHYEGPTSDKHEAKIAELRKQLHLLVTGLVFPERMSTIERVQIQSEIFLDINSNAKPVQADVLLHIKMTKDPLSDIGLARRVIEKLNKMNVFYDKFEMSALDESKIKIASIVKYALRYLVTISPRDDRVSFYTYWAGDKDALNRKDDAAYYSYIDFCAGNLNMYFSAVRKNNEAVWNDPNAKLLSTVAINGFIIAYSKQLKINGIKDFNFFDEKLNFFTCDYSKDGFEYTSSQYGKFSERIISEAFSV